VKKFTKIIGLIALICFSFFYTDKTLTVIKEQDPIMIKLKEVKDNYKIDPIDATIYNDTIIPGLYGKKVNINESYSNMKKLGMFNENLLVFEELEPSITINKNYDKYITLGNINKSIVALIIKLDSLNNIDNLINILNEKEIPVTFFISNDLLESNMNKIYELSLKNEIYNYGNNGYYTNEILLNGNNIINRLSKNESLYCYCEDSNINTIELCSKNKMYTIKPNIIIKNSLYNEVKNNLGSGSLISFNLNQNNLKELKNTIDFIKQKGYKLDTLSNTLSEKN